MRSPQPISAPTVAPPQAGLLLVLFAVPAIVGYLALATVGCWGAFGGTRAEFVRSTFAIFFGSFLTWLHYRAVFRAERSAAKQLHNLYFACILGLAITSMGSFVVMVVKPQTFSIPVFTVSVLLLMFVLFTWMLLTHWVNNLEQTESKDESRQMRRYSLREMLLGMTLAAGVLGASSYLVQRMHPRPVEHVSAAQCPFALPAAARDVSFCYTRSGRLAYEFSIDEAGAAEWAASLDLELVQNITESLEMKRFGWLHPTWRHDLLISIDTGWDAEGYVNGKQVVIAYDDDEGRAYYFEP